MIHDNPNTTLANSLLLALNEKGIEEYCVCPGARNAPLVVLLQELSQSNQHCRVFYFFDERSAAFFALGRIRSTGRPVAVVTTSGTAVGELLPATMEAHYAGMPLVLVTADRPRGFRGTGAPQTAEQVGIFGVYVNGSMDLESGEYLDQVKGFSQGGALVSPFHVNVCFDEPLLAPTQGPFIEDQGLSPPGCSNPSELNSGLSHEIQSEVEFHSLVLVKEFFQATRYPIAIVSLLRPEERESVVQFLLDSKIPAYFESISGLREDPRLESVRLHDSTRVMERALQADYPVDGVLRIGGIPTLRLWRDLEGKYLHLKVLSISRTKYSGLSRKSVLIAGELLKICSLLRNEVIQGRTSGESLSLAVPSRSLAERFIEIDKRAQNRIQGLLVSEPQSEPGMVYALSRLILADAEKKANSPHIYLGNSLPIREWDLAATREFRGGDIWASRGLNGIDGQISTFLGFARARASNWALVGDLTAFYDLQGPWVLPQLLETQVNLVIMNNGGGKIFSKMFPQQEFQNKHELRFSALADLWKMHYSKWEELPAEVTTLLPEGGDMNSGLNRIIELIPNEQATHRFWEQYESL